MTAQSNTPFPKELCRWKDGQWVYFFNHKENEVIKLDDPMLSNEGSRYQADYTIVKSTDETAIKEALTRSMLDPVLEKYVIENIEVEAKPAIDTVKTYKPDAQTTDKISSILLATPVKIAAEDIIPK